MTASAAELLLSSRVDLVSLLLEREEGNRGVYCSAVDKVAYVRLVGGNLQRWSINM